MKLKVFLLLLSFLGIFIMVLLSGCNSNDISVGKTPPSEVVSETKTIATIPNADIARTSGASHSGPTQVVFSETGRGVAFVTGKEGSFKVMHEGKSGKTYRAIDYLMVSKDGKRVMYSAQIGEKWCLVVDGVESEHYDAVGFPKFSNDGRHVLYDVQEKGKWRLVVDRTKGEPYHSYYDKTFSPDSTKIFAIENAEIEGGPRRLVIYDLKLKRLSSREVFTNGITYNHDQTRVAMIVQDQGKQRVLVYNFIEPDSVKESSSYDAVGDIVFGADGASVAFVGMKEGGRYLIVNGQETPIPDGEITASPVLGSNVKDSGIIMKDEQGFYLFLAGKGPSRAKRYEEAAFLTFNKDSSYVHAARNGKKQFYVVNGKEGPAFDKILEPRFSPDGQRIVCRVRKDGKRFVAVMDLSGKIVNQHPSYEMVFPLTFTADGKSVAYGVKEGGSLIWKVEKL